jgi:metal-dependent HD superfamily phosphatase/phosphodiesterase
VFAASIIRAIATRLHGPTALTTAIFIVHSFDFWKSVHRKRSNLHSAEFSIDCLANLIMKAYRTVTAQM